MIERLICISLNWGAVDPKVCADLYVVLCVYIRFLCFYELGVASKRAAGGFFLEKKSIPGFVDYVNSGNCQNCQNFSIYGIGDLSKKTRAEKSRILAVLRLPDLSRRAVS